MVIKKFHPVEDRIFSLFLKLQLKYEYILMKNLLDFLGIFINHIRAKLAEKQTLPDIRDFIKTKPNIK